jgi:eukaryotic-like serine/threonine-protein kinase
MIQSQRAGTQGVPPVGGAEVSAEVASELLNQPRSSPVFAGRDFAPGGSTVPTPESQPANDPPATSYEPAPPPGDLPETKPHVPVAPPEDTRETNPQVPSAPPRFLPTLGIPPPRQGPLTTNPEPVNPATFPESPQSGRPLPLVPGYEVLGELGRGGMGVVYKARQISLNRQVALKMIRAADIAAAADLARFRAEAEAVARLRHPNVVQVYEIGEHNGLPFFTLEFIEGGTLAELLKRQPPAPREAARLVQKLAEAVQSAHQAGIVHRDLKPGNILLQESGIRNQESAEKPPLPADPCPLTLDSWIPKITDFGLAKYMDPDRRVTASGALMGTPCYAPPEQMQGETDAIGPTADVYSLGAILYEMLSGKPPFVGESALAIIYKVVGPEPVAPIPPERKTPRDLQTICMKCLEKSVARRYATAQEVADELGRFLRSEPIRARPPGWVGRTWLWCQRNPVAASILFAVTLGLLFSMWHFSRLSTQIVEETAIEGARHQTEMLHSITDVYSSVIVDRVKQAEPPSVEVRHDFLNKKGAIPNPATMTMVLGEAIGNDSASGVQVKLYSPYPWAGRSGGCGLPGSFGVEAWNFLGEHPDQAFYRFEDDDGRRVLRYATPQVMTPSCVNCHNTHPDSPKKDWKVGDVRGVLEIVRPLDKDVARTQASLRSSFLLILALLAGLLAIAVGALFLARRRKAALRGGATGPG